MPRYLLADIGSTFTKLLVVDTEDCAIISQATAPTTVSEDVNRGFEAARRKLQPAVNSKITTLVCSSAAGGLQIAAVGLVPQLTMSAARQAALGAGGKVVHAYAYELTSSDVDDLRRRQPDMILLAGGTDGGDRKHILHNARILARDLPEIPVIVAGNRTAHKELREIFGANTTGKPTDVVFTQNVLPEINRMNLEPARHCIRDLFLRRIVYARGLNKLQDFAEILMPTPEAVMRGIQLLAEGLSASQPGIGDLLALDMGGATTDVYSCATGVPEAPQTVLKGLPEPYVKRTVEADIGMRHTIGFLAEQITLPDIAAEASLPPDALQQWIDNVRRQPDRIPTTPTEIAADSALARAGCRIAAIRHAGHLEETYTPAGRCYIQEGKDLGSVPTIIGTGGPLINHPTPDKLLSATRRAPGMRALLPRNPAYYIDQHYILWAMGLLIEADANAALTIMRNNLKPLASEESASDELIDTDKQGKTNRQDAKNTKVAAGD